MTLLVSSTADAASSSVRVVPATMERVGKLGPGEAKRSAHRREAIALAPVVLFSGLEPVLTLAVRAVQEDRPKRETMRLEPLGGPWPRRAPFPLDLQVSPVPGAGDEGDEIELILPFDLDGDGVDELLLARRFDGVRVYSTKRERFHAAPGVKPGQGHHRVRAHQTVRLGLRSVVYLLVSSAARGKVADGEGAAKAGVSLLRIDERGIAAIPLEGVAEEPFSFLAQTDAAGTRVEQLVLFGVDPKEGLVVTLHGPDGTRRAGPYHPKVPAAERFELATTPGSPRVIAAFPMQSETYLWFFDLSGSHARAQVVSVTGTLHLLRVVADGPVPLAVVADKSRIYAIDAKGSTWGHAAGQWKRAAAPAPVLSIDGPGHEPVGIFPSGDGRSFLAVASRKKQVWKRSHAEILAAAERFLPAAELSDLKALLDPSAKEDWENARFDEEVQERLAWPIRHPESLRPERYRAVEELRRWVAESDLREETSFTLVREERPVLRFTVPGYLHAFEASGYGDQAVSWRCDGDRVTVVLSLAATDGSGKQAEPGFRVVRAAAAPAGTP